MDVKQPSWKSLPDWKHDLPASIVVFLVALPLCMGIAIASGAPVATGLITGIIGGLVVGMLSGSPLQVSGPAAGLTVLVYQFIQQYGIEKLGPVVLLAGVLQVVAAALHLGQWFRAVSPSVIQGMLGGIGILIIAGQFHVMIDDQPAASGWRNLITIPNAVAKSFQGPKFDTYGNRQARTQQLHELGQLHLRQVELAEQVHHLTVGAPPDSARRPAAGKRAGGKKPPIAAPADPEGDVTAQLQALAPVQQAIIDEVRHYEKLVDGAPLKTAISDAEAALVDLEAGASLAKDSQDREAQSLESLRDSRKNHKLAAFLGLLTIAIIVTWQAVFARYVRFLPAPLVAVGIATVAAVAFGLPVIYIELPDNLLDEVFIPSFAELALLADGRMILSAAEFALIASAEALLCAAALDKLHRGPRARFDQELGAQGIGNMVCGLVSALPLTGLIVRSTANVNAGGRTRYSAVLHGVWILLLVTFFAWLLRWIPVSALAAVLVYTGYKLITPHTIKEVWKRGRFEMAIYLATVIAIVAVDLLTGVLVGISLAIAKLVWILSRLDVSVDTDHAEQRSTLTLKGSATFLRLPKLATALEEVPNGYELYVNVEQLDHIDHAALDLLQEWEVEHQPQGSSLVLDRESLAARFWRRAQPHSNGEYSERQVRQRQVPI